MGSEEDAQAQWSQPTETEMFMYDVFICHLSTAKECLAIPVKDGLEKLRLIRFLDETDMYGSPRTRLGQLFEGIGRSRVEMCVLSPDFTARRWPVVEM